MEYLHSEVNVYFLSTLYTSFVLMILRFHTIELHTIFTNYNSMHLNNQPNIHRKMPCKFLSMHYEENIRILASVYEKLVPNLPSFAYNKATNRFHSIAHIPKIPPNRHLPVC